MTNVPEAFLAREAQLAYCAICAVSDYDCWMDDPSQHVSVDLFLETFQNATDKARSWIAGVLLQPVSDTPSEIRQALAGAVLTPEKTFSDEQQAWLSVLRQ